ncbi:hypothetical protein ACZ98_23775 (plasmid) [Vibrio parahaemolyticus]|nr:hypothetical protein ACZ98_23775 [Vibrio parahaemolyticus]
MFSKSQVVKVVKKEAFAKESSVTIAKAEVLMGIPLAKLKRIFYNPEQYSKDNMEKYETLLPLVYLPLSGKWQVDLSKIELYLKNYGDEKKLLSSEHE